MSPVEIYKSTQFIGSYLVDDWAEVFDHPRNLVLVETQDEFDYIWAMQMVYGGEVQIEFTDGSIMRMYRMRPRGNGRVYCTWNPNDPNRI